MLMRLDDDVKEDVGYLSLIKISLDNANYLRKLKKKTSREQISTLQIR